MRKLEPGELSEVWDEYKATQSIDSRNRLIEHYGSLVRYMASRVAMGLPSSVDRDDLTSYGQFGLIGAIESYDRERGVKFETYAAQRIRGSIIDELRKIDWVPRSIRSKVRDIEKTRTDIHLELGREPTNLEIADRLDILESEVVSLVSQAQTTTALITGGLDDEVIEDSNSSSRRWLANSATSEAISDVASNPEELVEAGEVNDLVASAVSAMPERYKAILVLYYVEQMTLAEIGSVLGVTESRVCQLQSKVLTHLRETLAHGVLSAA